MTPEEQYRVLNCFMTIFRANGYDRATEYLNLMNQRGAGLIVYEVQLQPAPQSTAPAPQSDTNTAEAA